MTLVSLKADHTSGCVEAPAKPRPVKAPAAERLSDVWPDWSTELGEVEIAKSAEKNKPSAVLWDAARAIAVSIGMVVLLMAVLSVLHVR